MDDMRHVSENILAYLDGKATDAGKSELEATWPSVPSADRQIKACGPNRNLA